MASKLKVEQLRHELGKRGLDTTGTKPFLVQRLEEALLKEEKKKDNANNATENNKRKRGRESDVDNNEDPNKFKAIEEFRQMNVKQLRERATLRGISTVGTKKELLDRLCEDAGENSLCVKEEEEEEEKESIKEEKIVTATKKGVAVLDQGIPDEIKAHYHVLQQGDDIYDAMLNQTNVGQNNNKFFVIQLLESDDSKTYMVHNRWGRVGVKGQTKLHGPFTSLQAAIDEFQTKFFNKTKNYWCNRKDFVCHPKCYTLLEMDYDEKGKESDVIRKTDSSIGTQLRETKLEPRVAKFISVICNISMMKQQMMEIGYNADKLPLGKLSKSTILKGYDVLKRIADVIDQSNRSKLEQLSSEFYTVIPHDFGFRKMRDFIIDTPQKLKKKLEMVEALGEIEVASKLLMDDTMEEEDPLHYRYQQLHCELVPLDNDSEEFAMIVKYIQNTHAKTHSSYTVDVAQIFKVTREGELERFKKFSRTKNRMLLWHGSRLTNWTGILSQGLRIAPPEAPVTGYMFGKGVYFADMFSKSANYCYSNSAFRTGVLLLCEVALGDMAELLQAKSDANKLPDGKLSTKGVGATAPDPSEAQTLDDGVIVPLGKPKEQKREGALWYNEYIVYNVDQIRMRYLIQVSFKYTK
ncbi:poly(ADP-ribose) polymerase 2, poly(ADP-ribose) polymerase [Hibiscus trionum]|uniref:Poly [ADP-ribose] polymerase n=1 Tax=Hibiscus trionum TaxID=183268 RepID=A0A9W7GX09_HIBTR|nr:poly(ADP-ribose) polymerase 2, poly(ADP-ribose) polymerase [Hibiscus trionum]